MRLDPKLRYLAELAALKQRRTVSSFIEWAIEYTLSRECIEEASYENPRGTTFFDVASKLWDVDDADRFVRLALNYPDLLTHEEQKRWKLIRENGFLWTGNYAKNGGQWTWQVAEGSLRFDQLRAYWDDFCAVARDKAPRESLPQWTKKDPAQKPIFEDMDDDIPF